MSEGRSLLFEQGYLAGFKDLAATDRILARRVMAIVNSLAVDPQPDHSVHLGGGSLVYRLDIDDVRVMYEVADDAVRIWSLGRVPR
ncbi:type II toxin-antitoxin system RelE/ParE family toxin [Kribbella sp. NPDC048915]|uniref:type II toxin-antitoxin system RelE family toxin n=1 Tax=Kribbella sp. NPDC048915 TaxID=3155148 RepID=UPI0033E13C33